MSLDSWLYAPYYEMGEHNDRLDLALYVYGDDDEACAEGYDYYLESHPEATEADYKKSPEFNRDAMAFITKD